MRGSGQLRQQLSPFRRSIPAYAGFSWTAAASARQSPVHPRASGVQRCGIANAQRTEGPSPRVRGSVTDHILPVGPHGSIPAQAGVRASAVPFYPTPEVHPRACGVQKFSEEFPLYGEGPSPRKRGSETITILNHKGGRSIPARAGFSSPVASLRTSKQVHPRASGVQDCSPVSFAFSTGPSPRKRG